MANRDPLPPAETIQRDPAPDRLPWEARAIVGVLVAVFVGAVVAGVAVR